jgi:flagellin
MDRADETLAMLSQVRGLLDAQDSRLDIENSAVQSARVNYLDAYSRIADADVARESSEIARSQILQQIASAVLAQANLQPQIDLRLIGGKG